MRRAIFGTALSIALLAGVALATHVEPAKAKKIAFSLVNAFGQCGSPNTATQSNGTPACAPPFQPSLCAFMASGSGTLTFALTGSVSKGDEDVKIAGKLTGLNASCEGLPLDLYLSYRATTDDCPEGSCTTIDVTDFPVMFNACVVSAGKCAFKTTLSAANPSLIPTGKNTGLEIYGCGLKEPFGPPSFQSVRCGLLVK